MLQQYALPLSKLGMANSLLLPIAGLGSQSTGTTTTTQQTDPFTQLLSAAALGGSIYAKSDRNHKEIHGAGILPTGEYVFNYHGSDEIYHGRMAQDIEKDRPDAVMDTPLLGKFVTAE